MSIDATEITHTFSEYYKSLYKSKRGASGENMEGFLQGIIIPTLTEDNIDIEAPVTLDELQRAVAGMSHQKSPGPDGSR